MESISPVLESGRALPSSTQQKWCVTAQPGPLGPRTSVLTFLLPQGCEVQAVLQMLETRGLADSLH